jgi:hypothetical protein
VNPYAYRGSDPFAPPPYRAEGSSFHGFVVETGWSPLQRLLDAELNAIGGGRRFVPVLPFVVVTYVAIERSSSPDAPTLRQGYYTENDLMVWMLVAEVPDGLALPRIGWYVPLVWVDHAIAVIEGREGFGYPKNLGTIEMADLGASAARFSTTAALFPGAPDQPVTDEVINTVELTAGRAAARAEWSSLHEAVDAVLERLVGDATQHRIDGVASAFDLTSVLKYVPHQVFLLRQLRAPGDPSATEVQEVLVSPVADLTFHDGGLLDGEWTVDFPAHPTLDVAALLGLDGPTVAKLAYRITIDVTLGIPDRAS